MQNYDRWELLEDCYSKTWDDAQPLKLDLINDKDWDELTNIIGDHIPFQYEENEDLYEWIELKVWNRVVYGDKIVKDSRDD